jgi:YD repeat-containing protein
MFTAANQISGNSYDAAGNQISVNGDTVSYDAENRAVQVVESPSLGGGTETIAYDASGQRIEKIMPMTEREHPLQLRPDTSFTVLGSRVERLIEL